jgi:hypothetical protein
MIKVVLFGINLLPLMTLDIVFDAVYVSQNLSVRAFLVDNHES